MLGSDDDIVRLIDTFDKHGFLFIAYDDIPSSKEAVECLANIMFYVTKLDDTPKLLGCPPIILPEYICSKRIIYALTTGLNGRYTDNLCFFQALCYYQGETIAGCPNYPKEKKVLKLFRKAFLGRNPRLFPGVELSDIPYG